MPKLFQNFHEKKITKLCSCPEGDPFLDQVSKSLPQTFLQILHPDITTKHSPPSWHTKVCQRCELNADNIASENNAEGRYYRNVPQNRMLGTKIIATKGNKAFVPSKKMIRLRFHQRHTMRLDHDCSNCHSLRVKWKPG